MTVVMLIEFSRRTDNYFIRKGEVLRPLYTLIGQGIRPDDNVAIVAYDIKPVVITDFTGDGKALTSGLNLLIQNNATFSESNLYDALSFVLQGGKAETVDFGGGGLVKGVDYVGLKGVETRSAVILVTLGIDTFSKINYDEIRKIVAVRRRSDLFDRRGKCLLQALRRQQRDVVGGEPLVASGVQHPQDVFADVRWAVFPGDVPGRVANDDAIDHESHAQPVQSWLHAVQFAA